MRGALAPRTTRSPTPSPTPIKAHTNQQHETKTRVKQFALIG